MTCVPQLENETNVKFEELLYFKRKLRELEEIFRDIEFVPLAITGMGGRAGVVVVRRSAHIHCYNKETKGGCIIKFIFRRGMYSGPGQTEVCAAVATLTDSIIVTESFPNPETLESREPIFTIQTPLLEYQTFYHTIEWFCVPLEISDLRNRSYKQFDKLISILDPQGKTMDLGKELISHFSSACAAAYKPDTNEDYSCESFKCVFQELSPFLKCSWASKAKSARK